jgi:hypothetical protein
MSVSAIGEFQAQSVKFPLDFRPGFFVEIPAASSGVLPLCSPPHPFLIHSVLSATLLETGFADHEQSPPNQLTRAFPQGIAWPVVWEASVSRVA